MGQSYDVTYSLKIKDRQKLIDAVNAYIDETNEKRIRWSLDDRDRNNLTDLMKIVITDRGFMQTEDEFYSCFDATYSWEWVMMEVFEVMSPYLEDGSSLEIYPDYGRDLLVIENDEVKVVE